MGYILQDLSRIVNDAAIQDLETRSNLSTSSCAAITSSAFKTPKDQVATTQALKLNPAGTYLEVAIVHASKHGVLPQLLDRDPRARNAKGDPGQEPRVVPDSRSSQDRLDFPFVDASFPRQVARLQELDWRFRQTEVAVPATLRWHGFIVREMAGQFPVEAAAGGDEVDDALDALHVALFSGFNLRVDGCDDLTFRVFALREVFEDAEAVHYAAWLEFDGSGVIPFLQFLHGVRSGEASASSSCVDVDFCPLFSDYAGLFEGLGDW